MWVVKLDPNLNIIWEEVMTYEGIGRGECLALGNDGSIYIGGRHSTNPFLSTTIVFKLDTDGSLLWEFNVDNPERDHASTLAVDKDNNLIVVSSFSGIIEALIQQSVRNDIFVYKLNPNDGSQIWRTQLGGNGFEKVEQILLEENKINLIGMSGSNDGDFASSSSPELWFSEIDYDGNQIRNRIFGGNAIEEGKSIFKSIDGGYWLYGYSSSGNSGDISNNYGNYDAIALKLSPEISNTQSDESDAEFSIVQPNISTSDLLDFGQVPVDFSKDSTLVSGLTNLTGARIILNSIQFDSPTQTQFELISPQLPFTLEGNESINVEYRFTPNSETVFNAQVDYQFQGSTFIQELRGEGIVNPIELTGSFIDFEEVLITESKNIRKAVVQNTSNSNIDILEMEIVGPDFNQYTILNPNEYQSLAPNESIEIDVLYTPNFEGRSQSQIAISYNGGVNPVYVQLYGTGIDNDLISVSSIDLDFGGVIINNSVDDEILSAIINIGNQDVTISGLAKTKINEPFEILDPLNDFTLNPGQSQDIRMNFSPTQVGDFETSLTFTASGLPSTFAVNVLGTGLPEPVNPELSIQVGSGAVEIGNELVVPIVITNDNDLEQIEDLEFSFDVSFDTSILLPLDYPSSTFTNDLRSIQFNYSDLNIEEQSILTLENLRFQAALGKASSTDLVISNFKSSDSRVIENINRW